MLCDSNLAGCGLKAGAADGTPLHIFGRRPKGRRPQAPFRAASSSARRYYFPPRFFLITSRIFAAASGPPSRSLAQRPAQRRVDFAVAWAELGRLRAAPAQHGG